MRPSMSFSWLYVHLSNADLHILVIAFSICSSIITQNSRLSLVKFSVCDPNSAIYDVCGEKLTVHHSAWDNASSSF